MGVTSRESRSTSDQKVAGHQLGIHVHYCVSVFRAFQKKAARLPD